MKPQIALFRLNRLSASVRIWTPPEVVRECLISAARLNRLSASVRIWTQGACRDITEGQHHGLNRLSASVRIWTKYKAFDNLKKRMQVLIAFRLQSEFGPNYKEITMSNALKSS